MAKKQKTQEPQGTQEKQQKRTKAKAVDIAIYEAKNKEAGTAKDIIIELPGDPLYIDELNPNSPTYNPEKIKIFQEQLRKNSEQVRTALDDTQKRFVEMVNKINKSIVFEDATLKAARLYEAFQSLVNTIAIKPELAELAELLPYIETLAASPELQDKGTTTGEILDALEFEGTDKDGHIIPGSKWETLILTARALKEKDDTAKAQTESRKQRRETRENAQKANAIMTLQDGRLPIVSAEILWDAFGPGKIFEIGTMNPAYIDKTGRVMKSTFDDGEIIPTEQTAPIQAYLILSAITANSVENVREEFVKSGDLTFYVKGVIDQLSNDPRGLLPADIADDGQLDINRKTAAVLYLENLFKPLQTKIGMMPNGSRYSVFNYKEYDADNDTMTINTPYIYQLLKGTQAAYMARKESIKAARIEGKQPRQEDYKPLELNSLLKGPAITEDAATLEAALYITNIMLAAGSGKNKKTDLIFKTLVDHCPTMKQRIAEIEASDRQNKAAFINRELQKIGKAIALILNPEKCTATTYFEIISIDPSKKLDHRKGEKDLRKKMQFISPTRSKLTEKLVIKWNNNHKEEHENS